MLADCIPLFFGICLYECGTKKPVVMKLSTDAFYQTNHFPQPYNGDLDNCNITFTFDEPDKEVQIIVIKTELLFDEKHAVLSNTTTYETYFTPTYSFKDHYTKKTDFPYSSLAQFGYIAFEYKDLPRCILATKDPIFLYNEYEVIFIQSDFAGVHIPSDSCQWKFSTFKEYGFKVVIQSFEPLWISSLEIKNSTDTFVNYRSAKIEHAYYNSDNYLQIDVYKSNNRSIEAFKAYITVVKKIEKITYACEADSDNEGNIMWYMGEKLNSFNAYCSYDFIINNTSVEYDVSVEGFLLEKNVDVFKYTYDDVNGQKHVYYADGNYEENAGDYTKFTLFGYPNGSDRHYLWEIELDGSVPSFGSDVFFKKIVCQCIGKSLPCTADSNGNPVGIMNQYQSRYCGNLKCNFTFEPCSTSHGYPYFSDIILMQFAIAREYYDRSIETDGAADIFTIYSDGVVALHLELDTFNLYENEYVVFMNSSKNNIFEVITYSSRLSKTLSLQTMGTRIPPVVKNIILTASEPYAVIDTGLYQLNTVKVQNFEKNQTFVIYSNTGYRMQIFENENLFVSYDPSKCFGEFQPHVCNITSNEFAVYVPSSHLPYPILFVQLSNYYQKGCVFNQNIFITKETTNFPIAVLANSKDNCVTRILIAYDIYMTYFIILDNKQK